MPDDFADEHEFPDNFVADQTLVDVVVSDSVLFDELIAVNMELDLVNTGHVFFDGLEHGQTKNNNFQNVLSKLLVD